MHKVGQISYPLPYELIAETQLSNGKLLFHNPNEAAPKINTFVKRSDIKVRFLSLQLKAASNPKS